MTSLAPAPGGFWAGYWKSLKPLSVEEPIDVWVHRPIAYLLARACLPTPITPNLITCGSIVLGLASGASFVMTYPGHLPAAGALLFASAIFDCADGQLARLRGTSSKFGRMLDGVADLIVSTATVAGAIWVLYTKHSSPTWVAVVTLVVAIATAVTGSFHTTMYDHYKNVYLRLTTPASREGEDYATALRRYQDTPREKVGVVQWIIWAIYLFYVKSQEDHVAKFDPHTASSLGTLPPYTETNARIYRAHAEPAMRLWRGWFGFGFLVFGISVSTMLDVLEAYMLFRFFVLNAVFYGHLRPRQREASRAAFAEMARVAG